MAEILVIQVLRQFKPDQTSLKILKLNEKIKFQ